MTNNDFSKIVDTTDEWISARTGMSVRHLAGMGECTWHMGAKAAEKALEAAGISAEAIDMIIVTTVTSDHFTPSAACLVQRALGANNAFAFDINAACSGFPFALDMARRYLACGDIRNVLIVCAERLSRITNYSDRSTCVLFGDGAGAAVVTGSDRRFASHLGSDPKGAHLIYAKAPDLKVPFLDEADAPPDEFMPGGDLGIHMDGREVYKFATKVMPEAVEKACEKLNITTSEISIVIPHQANYRIIETAAKNLGLPMDNIYVNIQNYGNTSSASIVIGLDECIRDGIIKRGELVCIVGFGAGLTYGACVFEY